MSMSSWTVTGFGVRLDDISKASLEKKVEFIKTFLPDVCAEMSADFLAAGMMSDPLEFWRDWIDNYHGLSDGSFGFGVMFAEAINENEDGFAVDCCVGEFRSEAAVLYEDRLPWEMSSRVKGMSAEDMRGVFRRYLRVLSIESETEISRQSVEYFG